MKILVTKEYPPTQKSTAKSLNTSVETGNKIMNRYLELKKAIKHNVHQLFESMELKAHFLEPM